MKNTIKDTQTKKHLIVVIFEGLDDELGNMNSITCSNEKEFDERFLELYESEEELIKVKTDSEYNYFTFYECENEKQMNGIVLISDSWSDLIEEETKYLEYIAKEAKTYDKIIF
jgi:hypothetical protein